MTVEPLLDVLASHSQDEPARVAFYFQGEPHSIGDLWAAAGRVGAELLHQGLGRGERVVMALPNGPGFFHAFYGVQRAGGVAVPLFPDSGLERLLGVSRLCGARWLIVPSAGSVDAPPSGPLVTSVAELKSSSREIGFPEVRPEDIAYIQYTSGSTGNPKGVQLSHANLAANVEQLIAGMEITRDEVFVSWLPAFHDMGLVLMTMAPFRLGASLHLLPSSLGDVATWLETIERHRGTFTAAPDFAYRLLLRRVGDPPGYDLSSLRVALNAAEPVRLATLKEFERRFGLRHVMMPGYGLAEATVGVSMWKPGTEVRTDEEGRLSVGRPFPEVEITIFGEGGECDSGEVGEILVRSPGNTRGYLGNPEASCRLFRSDGFLRTGDVGYLDGDGYLYIVGRRKNIIIHAGRNVAPLEIEETVDAWPFVRYSAAVGIDRGGPEGEQIYVFAELRPPPPHDGAELQARAVDLSRAVHGRLGIRPARVYLLEPHSIPLTDTGKIRYPLLRERYLSGELRENKRIVFPDF
jgi:acyl-CoA synthetase (AMP-forming)/AMP-acid ligase II